MWPNPQESEMSEIWNAETHTNVILNNLTKPELVQFFLNTEANMRAQISTITAEVKEANSYFKSLRPMLL